MTPAGPEYLYVEKPSIELLEYLGWTPVDAFHETLGAQGTLGRDSQHDVVLTHRLRSAMRRFRVPKPRPAARLTTSAGKLRQSPT